MARPEKTVFISYRRNDVSWALAVYENLTNNGFDVFFDYESIESGDFEQIILVNIKARAHFLIILTPTALDRCNEPGDWLRREIEIAIGERRNIVPLFFNDFDFAVPSVAEKLTGELGKLKRYNGLEVPAGYFSEAMERLREKYLDITLDSVLHPIPVEVQKEVKKQQEAADQAILRGESSLSEITEVGKKWIQNLDFTHLVMGGVILLAVSTIFLSIYYFTNNPLAALMPAATNVPSVTPFVSPTTGSTDAPPDTPVIPASPVPVPVVGSVLISDVDGMEMVYVPAGEFRMGSETGEPDERPVHTVSLDAYWIDRTEVTNAMYARCVEDGTCHPPSSSSSSTRDLYFGNPEFKNYPVLYVSWGLPTLTVHGRAAAYRLNLSGKKRQGGMKRTVPSEFTPGEILLLMAPGPISAIATVNKRRRTRSMMMATPTLLLLAAIRPVQVFMALWTWLATCGNG